MEDTGESPALDGRWRGTSTEAGALTADLEDAGERMSKYGIFWYCMLTQELELPRWAVSSWLKTRRGGGFQVSN